MSVEEKAVILLQNDRLLGSAVLSLPGYGLDRLYVLYYNSRHDVKALTYSCENAITVGNRYEPGNSA